MDVCPAFVSISMCIYILYLFDSKSNGFFRLLAYIGPCVNYTTLWQLFFVNQGIIFLF